MIDPGFGFIPILEYWNNLISMLKFGGDSYKFSNDWLGFGARRVSKRDSVNDVFNSNVSTYAIEQIKIT